MLGSFVSVLWEGERSDCVVCPSQAQQHRTFNSVVQKHDSGMGYTKPVYSLNGRTPTQHNGLAAEEGVDQPEEEGVEEDQSEEEVREDSSSK